MGRRAAGNGVSAWRLIVEELRREIADDVWPIRSKLPPEAELADRFGVHRNTVRHALAALAADGLVTSRRGSGTYVTGRPIIKYRIQTRTRLSTGLQVNGHPPGGRLLAHDIVDVPPTDVVEQLQLADRPALHMQTMRTVDGETITRSTHWFDAATTKGLPEAFRTCENLTGALRAVGVQDYIRASTTVQARIATATEAADMDLPAGSVVLVVRSLDNYPDGHPLQVTTTSFRADRIELDVGHGHA